MRLLTKNEVQDLKQKERGIEIREGAKLAQKIDVLRETASQEETKLTLFRIESLKQLHEQITSLVEKKDLLKKEVDELEDQKKQLIIAIESVKIINNQ